MGFETEKQLEVVKTSVAASAISRASPAKSKPKSSKKKRPRGPPDAGAPGRKEALRQSRWRFNGVGLASGVVVLACLWAAFFGSGVNQKLGQDGFQQLIGVAMFFAGRATKSERRKSE